MSLTPVPLGRALMGQCCVFGQGSCKETGTLVIIVIYECGYNLQAHILQYLLALLQWSQLLLSLTRHDRLQLNRQSLVETSHYQAQA